MQGIVREGCKEVMRMQVQDMDALVDAHGTAVYRFCLRLCGCRQEAEDLFQQTFLRATELCDRIDPDANPKAFLFSIAARTAQRRQGLLSRRQRIAPTQPLDVCRAGADAPDPQRLEDGVARDELRALTLRAIDGLPDRLRLPVVLFYGEELSVGEIAVILHIPQGSVKSRLHRARTLLKQRLEENGYESQTVFGST